MPKFDITSMNDDSNNRKNVSLTITHNCNLRCKYCYEPHIQRSKEIMDFEIAKKIIVKHMNEDDKFDRVCFDFFGGEPMLAFYRIREIIEWFHTIKWRKGHLFFISSNGTILNDEIKSWLIKHKDCVVAGISLDGNKTVHDMNRDNSYDLVLKNYPFFKETWPTQPSKMTINAETIPYVADSIIELEEMDAFFSANIVFENIWGNQKQKNKLLDIYAEQLEKLVNYYSERPKLFPVFPILTRHSETIYWEKGKDKSRFCGAGYEMITYDVDGKSHPCHRFMPWVTKREAPKQLVNRQKVWKPKECEHCKFILLCPTCAGYNWEVNGDSGIRTTYHCEAIKLEILASAKLEALKLDKMSEKKYLKNYSGNRKRLEAVLELLQMDSDKDKNYEKKY